MTFHAAHVLEWHPGKCSRLHGHTYKIDVTVEGPLNANGVIADFDVLSPWLYQLLIEPLDHTLLNDLIPNPTAEHIGLHIMSEVEKHELPVTCIRLWETPETSVLVTRN
ncbi:6-pyruvoyl trahydropterin synthase family protein [Clavibacter michiganensis]|uniref:6-pyruvoyl trahydropterin synthase family protein n=1 Tax=Clavibacter michiganensis TaxID=28447 RepID=UPI003464992A